MKPFWFSLTDIGRMYFALLIPVLRNEAEAEDLVQGLFLEVHTTMLRYDEQRVRSVHCYCVRLHPCDRSSTSFGKPTVLHSVGSKG